MNVKEAEAELARVMSDYRSKPYGFWESQIGEGPIVLETAAETGNEYQVEIEALWDGPPGGDIRVLFGIDDGGWRAFCPLTRDFVITEEGHCVEG
jgi:hypothetical protein